MAVHAAPAAGAPTLTIRGRTYPVLLPKLRDPRLHLAATIISLQVIGQIGFHFELSIAQILLAIGTTAVLEMAIAFRTQHVVLWPASAMLTGNGVAFVLRVPGTAHGDWWTLHGWWIFVATAAGSLLSKHVIRWRGEHVFNPSNIGLVVCFVALGQSRADPLDYWWGPMSVWLGLALAVIVTGGFAILWRLKLLRVALAFWAAFTVGIGVLVLSGHTMTARWHLGPLSGLHLWTILVTSPEVLVFLFFMITDPKTAPRSPKARLVYGVSLGLLAAALIAPTTTEFAAKVALLGSLAIVCAGMPLLRLVPHGVGRRLVLPASAAAVAAGAAVMLLSNPSAGASAYRALPPGALPPIEVLPSHGVQTPLDLHTAQLIAHDLLAVTPASTQDTLSIWLEQGQGQGPPTAVAQLAGLTYHLHQVAGGHWSLGPVAQPMQAKATRRSDALAGRRLTDVASSVGLDFRQDSFRYGASNEPQAMMGGGVCWLDYNGDGWQDLFAVNSYSNADVGRWEASGGLPRTALFENVHGRFRDVSRAAHADLPVQGDGCVAADLNGDGRPDLVVTTTSGIDLLWNRGNGTFVRGARAAGMDASGWYTGVTVADVNGDGRPDVFVAGYADPNRAVANSLAGFPTNLAGVRDLLYLNVGNGPDGRARFREVGIQAGLEAAAPRHGLGAQFVDVNGDGRPDIYVADDEDPNQLYVNVPWPGGAKADPAGLGFRFEERGAAAGVADPYAGMGIASAANPGGSVDVFVTNSRNEPSAAFRAGRASGPSPAFANARPAFDPALGTGFAGWGASWVDLANSGRPDLVLAAGAIPVTSLGADAEPVRVLAPVADGAPSYGDASSVLGGTLKVNGRGVAAADAGNDGRLDVAVNTIGGKLLLLRPSGPSGHWLDVALSRFVPGAVVTAVLPDGRRMSRQVQAGSSYLSSEDPRVHFGLGTASRLSSLTVRYPWGASSQIAHVRADHVVEVAVPARPAPRVSAAAVSPALAGCSPAGRGDGSIATVWDKTAVAVLRADGEAEPVQARDLFDVSAAMWDAWAAYDPSASGRFVTAKASAPDVQAARGTAISYAAYRLLLWRASLGSNLAKTFGMLTARLRSLCLSPDFTSTAGGSAAALGNRIAAAAVVSGRKDGSLESLHYVDPGYAPQNAPLVVSEAGSTVHDATFWQPLALATVAAHGLGAVPASVQTFVGAQWGGVRGFALRPSRTGLPIDPGAPQLGVPSSAAYKQAAVAVIRATAGPAPPGAAAPSSPLDWSRLAASLRPAGTAAQRLRSDVERYFALAGALDDAAIATWGAKRHYETPRPISMIRYLGFQGQSSHPKAPSYSREGLPLVPGLIELVTKASSAPGGPLAVLSGHVGQVAVRERGRWVLATRWTPPAATPASPGGVSAAAAFAYAADEVLTGLAGRSYNRLAGRSSRAGLTAGVELSGDRPAGRTIGIEVGRAALALARRYAAGLAAR
jgi:Na+-translocating ferredoxin:NAD+ oxidoreductase RnfD subunit